MSRPMRARGLKRCRKGQGRYGDDVAPHAGAWIETILILDLFLLLVAPHAGAWIETGIYCYAALFRTSRPMRARGLKLPKSME